MSYRCPMNCEKDKTYSMPGKCPVCGMKLTPAEGAGREGSNQGESPRSENPGGTGGHGS